MSFAVPKRVIEEGDTVILFFNVVKMQPVQVTRQIVCRNGQKVDNVYQCNLGALRIESLIGREYGSKVKLTKGYCYVLQSNPELWTINLPHRTQILYTPDISMILMELEIKPGSIVIEAGTGSGSLSHAIIRAIKDHGHLYTFDFHEARVQAAQIEFEDHGFKDYVTAQHRDVCSDGFTSDLDGKADAIFLDLPNPAGAIGHVMKSLKPTGGRFCGFSPCIEQVQATCEELERCGFLEIQTIELLQSEHIIKERLIPSMDLSFVKDKRTLEGNHQDQPKKSAQEIKKVLTTFNTPILVGHTGYLTFATYLQV